MQDLEFQNLIKKISTAIKLEIYHEYFTETQAEELFAALEGSQTIESLCMRGVEIEAAIVDDLSDYNIDDKDLRVMNAFERGNNNESLIRYYSNLIKNNSNIHSLDLSNNQMGNEGFKVMLDALKANDTIKKLNLSRNELKSEQAIEMIELFQENKKLTYLDLSKNSIDATFLKPLGDFLKENKTLISLDLSSNGFKEHDKITQIVPALLANDSLKELSLCYNNIRGRQLEVVVGSLQKKINSGFKITIYDENFLENQSSWCEKVENREVLQKNSSIER